MNLNQVTVNVSDIPRSIEFYQKLGLQLIVKSPHYARFVCPDGDATFSLHIAPPLPHPQAASVTLYFEREDLDEYVGVLRKKGIEFDLMPTDQRWLWREAHLRDPDGNALIIYHAGENRKNPPWRISEDKSS